MESSDNEIGEEEKGEESTSQEQTAFLFLDSMDGYQNLLGSLSATLRQGWLELASARHSMGDSRINSALLDLKPQSAATSVRITEHNPYFTLCKWTSRSCYEGKYKEDKLQMKSDDVAQLRHRGTFEFSGPALMKKLATSGIQSFTATNVFILSTAI